eukprot:29275-Eustigmatos_ZCMA.PRE.1
MSVETERYEADYGWSVRQVTAHYKKLNDLWHSGVAVVLYTYDDRTMLLCIVLHLLKHGLG